MDFHLNGVHEVKGVNGEVISCEVKKVLRNPIYPSEKVRRYTPTPLASYYPPEKEEVISLPFQGPPVYSILK